MNYRWLGCTGLRVSPLCFGTMSFGGDASEAEAGAMYAACRERGINFFDCADAYNGGRAEEILGRLVAHERDALVITSKVHNPIADDVNALGANRRHIVRAVEASLRRLDTDRLDILFMHRFDRNVPLEDTLRGLEALVRDGKVLYLGASNYAAWQVATALGICARHGWPRLDVLQPMYSLVKRQVEVEMLPLARAEQLGVITYSPVGGGLLSGKYGVEQRPNTGRLLDNPEYTKRYGEPWVYETAAAFTEAAKARDVHPVTLAVSWVKGNRDVTAPIIGARSVEQLQPSLAALDLDLDANERDALSALSRQPPPATDRLEELG